MSEVCVVGLGKLGACLAAVLARHHKVIGLDLNDKAVQKIRDGQAPVNETGLSGLIREVSANLWATTSYEEAVRKSKIAFVIVPTPSDETAKFSNEFVIDAVHQLGLALPEDDDFYTVVICSTVMPGSTRGDIKKALEEASGRKVGENVGLAYSPEFIALGSVIRDLTHPDMILIGADDEESLLQTFSVLATIPENEPRWHGMSTVNAEIAKLAVNAFVTMKISFANSLGEMCEQLHGGDATTVAKAIGSDERIGSKYILPGAPYGGPCFPRDAEAFYALGESLGVEANLAKATSDINQRQVIELVEKLRNHDRVSILGLSYKVDTPITERSFGIELLELLQFEGVICTVYDPRAKESRNGCEHTETAQECVRASEVIVIATPWPEFAKLNYKGKIVVDRWNIVPNDLEAQVWRFGQG